MAEGDDDGAMGRLFEACDLDGSGYIDKNELAAICAELNPTELSQVFAALDCDGDGKISTTEFALGFRSISETLIGNKKEQTERKRKMSYFDLAPTQSSLPEGRARIDEGEEGRAGARRQRTGRRKSLFDLVGNLDEGFTALTWLVQEFWIWLYLSLRPT